MKTDKKKCEKIDAEAELQALYAACMEEFTRRSRMDMEKCVDEVRRGIRAYREYEYSDRFLDAMTENAEGIVAGLVPRIKNLEKVKEIILDYVYCACTGLENAEGYPQFILYPTIAYTVDGVLSALGINHKNGKQGNCMLDLG